MTCPWCSSQVIHKPGSFLVIVTQSVPSYNRLFVVSLYASRCIRGLVSRCFPYAVMSMDFACCSVTFPAEDTYGVLG